MSQKNIRAWSKALLLAILECPGSWSKEAEFYDLWKVHMDAASYGYVLALY